MLDIKISFYHALPCITKEFLINNIYADEGLFGSMESNSCPEDCPNQGYDCHNMHFVPYSINKIKNNLQETKLSKLKLNNEEIKSILEELEEKLNVGDCEWCV